MIHTFCFEKFGSYYFFLVHLLNKKTKTNGKNKRGRRFVQNINKMKKEYNIFESVNGWLKYKKEHSKEPNSETDEKKITFEEDLNLLYPVFRDQIYYITGNKDYYTNDYDTFPFIGEYETFNSLVRHTIIDIHKLAIRYEEIHIPK